MDAEIFIVGYAIAWVVWTEIVGVAFEARSGTAMSVGFAWCSWVLSLAMVPVVALSVAVLYMPWLAPRVGEVLSLMTPACLILFALQQLERLPIEQLSEVKASEEAPFSRG